jgi:hypothetical protein
MLAGVIVTLCLHNLCAQRVTAIPEEVTARFSKEFKDASNVRWVKLKNIFQCRFYNEKEYCLAFFDESGQLILSGRKIAFDIAPLAVKKEAERIRKSSERKYDLLAIEEVYELNNSEGTTYFINLVSESLSMSIMAYGNGHSEILKKTNKIMAPASALVAGH